MRIFKNRSNGYREEVHNFSILWALLFGVFYFMLKGVWMHVAIQMVVSAILVGTMGAPGLVLVMLMWVGYAVALPGVLAQKYLRDGWVEVTNGDPTSEPAAGLPAYGFPAPAAASPADDRPCPFCAEPIKRAAIKCRHCGSAVDAAPSIADEQAAQAAARSAAAKVEALRPKGTCPNCRYVVPLDSAGCPRCKAVFGPGSSWVIKPL